VAQFIQTETHSSSKSLSCFSLANTTHEIIWFRGITLLLMLAECGVSLYGAAMAHSPALLAFGAIAVFVAVVANFGILAGPTERLRGPNSSLFLAHGMRPDLPLSAELKQNFLSLLYTFQSVLVEISEDLVQLRESGSMRFNPRGGYFEFKSIRSKK
jgi:hypothetical protein